MRRLLAAVALLFGLISGGVAYAAPHVGAYICPACYGFRSVAPRLYVDKDASEAQVNAALTNLKAANGRVLHFYPERASHPVWLLCLSETCQNGFGRGPLAMAYLNTFVFVYPDGATVPILAHEVAHAELHKRVGVLRFIGGAVPAWFDEGLAVYISGDERYLDVKNGKIIGCQDAELAELPSDGRLFRHLAATNAHALYTASACKVIDWMNEHGGMRGVIRLEQSVRNGASFSG